MTKQEWIREYTIDSMMYWTSVYGTALNYQEASRLTDSVLRDEASQGVVIKVERESFASICGYCAELDGCQEAHTECDKFKLEVDYVPTKSLIEEKDA